jgi:hypothetical protein
MKSECSLLCSQESSLDPAMSQINPDQFLLPSFFKIHFASILSSVFSLRVFGPEIVYHFLCLPFTLLALAISSSLCCYGTAKY